MLGPPHRRTSGRADRPHRSASGGNRRPVPGLRCCLIPCALPLVRELLSMKAAVKPIRPRCCPSSSFVGPSPFPSPQPTGALVALLREAPVKHLAARCVDGRDQPGVGAEPLRRWKAADLPNFMDDQDGKKRPNPGMLHPSHAWVPVANVRTRLSLSAIRVWTASKRASSQSATGARRRGGPPHAATPGRPHQRGR